MCCFVLLWYFNSWSQSLVGISRVAGCLYLPRSTKVTGGKKKGTQSWPIPIIKASFRAEWISLTEFVVEPATSQSLAISWSWILSKRLPTNGSNMSGLGFLCARSGWKRRNSQLQSIKEGHGLEASWCAAGLFHTEVTLTLVMTSSPSICKSAIEDPVGIQLNDCLWANLKCWTQSWAREH